MNREVTMESVFFAGFKAGYVIPQDDEPTGHVYFDARNEAWLKYVKELETSANA